MQRVSGDVKLWGHNSRSHRWNKNYRNLPEIYSLQHKNYKEDKNRHNIQASHLLIASIS